MEYMNGDTVYHVEIGESHTYFGSITAIYDVHTPDELGIKKTSLWTYGITEDHPFSNAKCTIRKGKIIRKKGGRYVRSDNR